MGSIPCDRGSFAAIIGVSIDRIMGSFAPWSGAPKIPSAAFCPPADGLLMDIRRPLAIPAPFRVDAQPPGSCCIYAARCCISKRSKTTFAWLSLVDLLELVNRAYRFNCRGLGS
jgi:hypothetical protein